MHVCPHIHDHIYGTADGEIYAGIVPVRKSGEHRLAAARNGRAVCAFQSAQGDRVSFLSESFGGIRRGGSGVFFQFIPFKEGKLRRTVAVQEQRCSVVVFAVRQEYGRVFRAGIERSLVPLVRIAPEPALRDNIKIIVIICKGIADALRVVCGEPRVISAFGCFQRGRLAARYLLYLQDAVFIIYKEEGTLFSGIAVRCGSGRLFQHGNDRAPLARCKRKPRYRKVQVGGSFSVRAEKIGMPHMQQILVFKQRLGVRTRAGGIVFRTDYLILQGVYVSAGLRIGVPRGILRIDGEDKEPAGVGNVHDARARKFKLRRLLPSRQPIGGSGDVFGGRIDIADILNPVGCVAEGVRRRRRDIESESVVERYVVPLSRRIVRNDIGERLSAVQQGSTRTLENDGRELRAVCKRPFADLTDTGAEFDRLDAGNIECEPADRLQRIGETQIAYSERIGERIVPHRHKRAAERDPLKHGAVIERVVADGLCIGQCGNRDEVVERNFVFDQRGCRTGRGRDRFTVAFRVSRIRLEGIVPDRFDIREPFGNNGNAQTRIVTEAIAAFECGSTDPAQILRMIQHKVFQPIGIQESAVCNFLHAFGDADGAERKRHDLRIGVQFAHIDGFAVRIRGEGICIFLRGRGSEHISKETIARPRSAHERRRERFKPGKTAERTAFDFSICTGDGQRNDVRRKGIVYECIRGDLRCAQRKGDRTASAHITDERAVLDDKIFNVGNFIAGVQRGGAVLLREIGNRIACAVCGNAALLFRESQNLGSRGGYGRQRDLFAARYFETEIAVFAVIDDQRIILRMQFIVERNVLFGDDLAFVLLRIFRVRPIPFEIFVRDLKNGERISRRGGNGAAFARFVHKRHRNGTVGRRIILAGNAQAQADRRQHRANNHDRLFQHSIHSYLVAAAGFAASKNKTNLSPFGGKKGITEKLRFFPRLYILRILYK